MKKQTKIYVFMGLFVAILMMTSFLTSGIQTSTQKIDSNTAIDKKFIYPEPETFTLKDGNIMSHVWSTDGSKVAYVTCPDGQNWNCSLMVTTWNLEDPEEIYDEMGSWTLQDYHNGWILSLHPNL